MSDSGILVAIEGIDGAGKTTQASLLVDALSRAGLKVVSSREPTDGVHGKRIRQSAVNGRLSLEEELRAFTEDRKEHVAGVVRPALREGNIVVLDRYYYSTLAYQGARGADIGKIRTTMESFAPRPDAVFLLDVNPCLCLCRIKESRGDIPNAFESNGNLTEVRAQFKQLTDDNIIRIDGARTRSRVHKDVLGEFVEGPLKKLCAKSYGCDDPIHCAYRLSGTCHWWNTAKRLSSAAAEA